MPIYTYEVLGKDGRPTGETFEEFQKMSDEPLARDAKGRACRKQIVASARVKMAKPRKREARSALHRTINSGKGVYNQNQSDPQVSMSLPYDPRDGVICHEDGRKVRKHPDGTISTYDPINSGKDRRPIIRNEEDRKRYCAYFNATHIKE